MQASLGAAFEAPDGDKVRPMQTEAQLEESMRDLVDLQLALDGLFKSHEGTARSTCVFPFTPASRPPSTPHPLWSRPEAANASFASTTSPRLRDLARGFWSACAALPRTA